MNKPTAAERDAFAQGAQAQRGGVRISFGKEIFPDQPRQLAYHQGWTDQWTSSLRGEKRKLTGDDFKLPSEAVQVNSDKANRAYQRKETPMTTRSADELAKLKSDFSSSYTGDPANLDAAFQQHLEQIDTVSETPAKAKGSTKKGGKAKAKAAPKAKAKAAPRPKGFRPTSDDRKTFNTAAGKVAGKDVKAPRLIPQQKDANYSDFLSGKVLKIDAEGNGSAVLNVVSAKDTKTILGTVTVAVANGKVKATGSKA